MTNADQLKACPFCGGGVSLAYTDQVDAVTFVVHIECDGCDLDFSRQYGAPNAELAEAEVIDLWNTRTQDGGGEAVYTYEWKLFDEHGELNSVCHGLVDNFGRHGIDYDSAYTVRKTPLYTHPSATANEDGQHDDEV